MPASLVSKGGSPVLSVVVPSYHTGAAIIGNLKRLTAALDASELPYEVIFVADGDAEVFSLASELASPTLRVLGYAENRGKGFALRYGVSQARGELVTFVDADMQIAPEEIGRMVALLRLYEADIVVGSKRHPMSKVDYPLTRRIQSVAYQLLVRLLFRVKVSDTQTGLKVLRRDVAQEVIDVALVKRFAFDLELLAIATRFGHTRITEAPVTIEQAFSSTTSVGAAGKVLQDTLAIFYRMRIIKYYDKRQGDGRGLAALQAQTPALLHTE